MNVLGSVHVFSAVLAAGVRRVVNTSTGRAIYGETDVVLTPDTTRPTRCRPARMMPFIDTDQE